MKIKKYISYMLITLAIAIILSSFWVINYFDNPTFEQILYHIYTSVSGTDIKIIANYLIKCLLIPGVITILFLIFNKKINKLFEKKWISNNITIASIIIFIASIYFSLDYTGCISYLTNQQVESTFIEENYVDPQKVNIIFPEKKKNLIVLYIESMESSYSSIDKGGLFKNNYIPNLTKIANNNISFSNTERMGGAYSITGTGWTTAGLVSSIAGIPIKSPFSGDAINSNPFIFPKITTLGEILEEAGYNEKLILGSEVSFGGIQEFFTNHGNFEIYDVETAKKEEYLNKNNKTSWGLQDKALLDYAKMDILELSKNKEPFYYNIITIDTHAPTGFTSEDCKKGYKNDYANAIACSDKHISEFINWIKEQDFFKKTTIVILGDHLSMNANFFSEVDSNERRVFNAFINSSATTERLKNRTFYQMDYFPTLLASIGVEIEGDRLGLGTNLFSNEKTLMEKYSIESINSEFIKHSKFYNDNILY